MLSFGCCKLFLATQYKLPPFFVCLIFCVSVTVISSTFTNPIIHNTFIPVCMEISKHSLNRSTIPTSYFFHFNFLWRPIIKARQKLFTTLTNNCCAIQYHAHAYHYIQRTIVRFLRVCHIPSMTIFVCCAPLIFFQPVE